MELPSLPQAASESATTTTTRRRSLTAATVSPAPRGVCEGIRRLCCARGGSGAACLHHGAIVRQWARRAAELRAELAAVAEIRDPRWWLVAGGAALDWQTRGAYVASDAEPSADTFIGHAAPPHRHELADALVH